MVVGIFRRPVVDFMIDENSEFLSWNIAQLRINKNSLEFLLLLKMIIWILGKECICVNTNGFGKIFDWQGHFFKTL